MSNFQTISDDVLNSMVLFPSKWDPNLELMTFPGSEDDQLIDYLKQCWKDYHIIDINLRDYRTQTFIHDITNDLKNKAKTILNLKEKDVWGQRSDLRSIMVTIKRFKDHNPDFKLIIIIRKLHYLYFDHKEDIRKLLESLLREVADDNEHYHPNWDGSGVILKENPIPLVVTTHISIGLIEAEYPSYGSSLSTRFRQYYELTPVVLNPEQYILEIIPGVSTSDVEKLKQMAGRNLTLINSCCNTIKPLSDRTQTLDIDNNVVLLYERCASYFESVWKCLSSNEKSLLISLATNSTKRKFTKIPRDKTGVWEYPGLLSRLIKRDLIYEDKEKLYLSSILFSYWILNNLKREDISKLIEELPPRKSSLNNMIISTLQYVDKNKELIMKLAFELFKK